MGINPFKFMFIMLIMHIMSGNTSGVYRPVLLHRVDARRPLVLE